MSLFTAGLVLFGTILFVVAVFLQSSLVESGTQKINRRVNGHLLKCPHCGGTQFTQERAQLNTTVMTFFKLDWLNKSADTFICSACGRIEWFMNARIEDASNKQSGSTS